MPTVHLRQSFVHIVEGEKSSLLGQLSVCMSVRMALATMVIMHLVMRDRYKITEKQHLEPYRYHLIRSTYFLLAP
jgi:hypothetical protein